MNLSMLELPLDPVIMVQRSESELLAYNIELNNVVQFKLPLNYETYILYQQMVINFYKKKHQHMEKELTDLKIMYKTVYANFVKMENQVKAYSSHNEYLLKKNREKNLVIDQLLLEKRFHEKIEEYLPPPPIKDLQPEHFSSQEETGKTIVSSKEFSESNMLSSSGDNLLSWSDESFIRDESKVEEKEIIPEKVLNQIKYENFIQNIYKKIRITSSYLQEPVKIVTFDRILHKMSNYVNQYHLEEYKIPLNSGFFFRIFFKKENTYIDSIYYTKSYQWTLDSYFHQLEHFVKDDSQSIFYLNKVMTERMKKNEEKQIFTKFFYRVVHLTFQEIQQIWIRVFDFFKLQSTFEIMIDDNEKYNHLIVFYPNEKRPLFMMNYDKERNRNPQKYHDFFMIWF